MALHNLVKEVITDTEGGRASTNYLFAGFREEKKVSREEKKAGMKPSWGPVSINKSSFTDVIKSLADLDNDILTMPYSTLVKYSERKLSAGLSIWIAETQEKNQDQPEFFRGLLISVKDRIAELDASKSVADPFGDCKRRFAKSAIFSVLSICENPAALVVENIQTEIDNLRDLQNKAKEVTASEYLEFLNSKEGENGTDDDGFVMLRKIAPKTPEVPEVEANKTA